MESVHIAENKTNISFSFFQVSRLKYHHFNNEDNVEIVWKEKHKHLKQ